MPEIAVKNVRLPELRLPSSDGLPRVEMPKIDVPRIDVPRIDVPRIEMPSVDVGQTLAEAASAVHLRRPASRPRWPLAVGAVIVASVAGWAIMSNEALRARLAGGVAAIRERLSAMRSGWLAGTGTDTENPIAFPAAETKPIEESPFTDEMAGEAPDYPEGLGSNSDGDVPQETRSAV